MKPTFTISALFSVKTLILALLILSVSFFASLGHQYVQITQSQQLIADNLTDKLKQNTQKLKRSIQLVSNVYGTNNNIDLGQLFNIINRQNIISRFSAIGVATSLTKSELAVLTADMHQKGFESFYAHNRDRSPAITLNNVNIVHEVWPYTPRFQQFLGLNLNSLPGFQEQIDGIKQGKKNTPLFIWQRNKLHSLLINIVSTRSIDGSTLYLKQRIFTLVDIQPVISKIITDAFSQQPVDGWLTYKQQESSLFVKSEQPHLLTNQYTINTPAGHDLLSFTVVIGSDIKDFDLYMALIESALISLFLLLLLTTIYYFRHYSRSILANQSRFNGIISNTQDAIIITSKKGAILYWNNAATRIFGHSSRLVYGKGIQQVLFDTVKQHENVKLALRDSTMLNTKTLTTLMTQNSEQIQCEVFLTALDSIDGDTEYAYYINDVTLKQKHDKNITNLAYYDSLTHLENRFYFSEHVSKVIKHQGTINQKQSSVLFLDLDGFKRVNDSLGHNVGDQLLQIMAKRLTNETLSLHKDSHLCRFGGDEFIFYIHQSDEENAALIASRILKKMEELVVIEDDEINVTASIGIAQFPEHGEDLETLLRHADTAMYRAKDNGKNTYSFYQTSMEEQLSYNMLVEKHLRTAIEKEEFTLHYQPQIDTKTLRVIGVEALIRWTSDGIGFVPPDKFISIAEESGQILQIGDWVTQEAINQLHLWQETPLRDMRIAINVSSQQLEKNTFIDNVYYWLEELNLSPDLLEIELTERTVMSNADSNIGIFSNIRDKGFSLSVDDFGTGYSSLSYLKRFPLSILKVDKSFVDGLPDDEEDMAICSSIIQLAHSLNMKVVAEGVETKDQLDCLTGLKCDYIQGYYFSRPMPSKDMFEWIETYHAALDKQQAKQQKENQHDPAITVL